MEILKWLQFIMGMIFLIVGLLIFAVQVFGVFKFGYILNRMHAAAMGDTLGIGACLLGLMCLSGWNFTTLKMLLVVCFLWCASPVSSHLISRLEVLTNPRLNEKCDVSETVLEQMNRDEEKEEKEC